MWGTLWRWETDILPGESTPSEHGPICHLAHSASCFGSLSVFFPVSLFCPLTSPSCLLLHGLQGLFLFSSVRSKQVGEALSVPSSSPHHGGPAGNVPRSLLRAFAKVFTAYFLIYVAFLCSSSSICDSARVSLTISPLYVRHLAAWISVCLFNAATCFIPINSAFMNLCLLEESLKSWLQYNLVESRH